MTEVEAYKALRKLLVATDAEGAFLGELDAPLTDVIHGFQTAPRPTGPHAVITPLGSRDTGESHALCYDTATYQGIPRVVEVRTEGVEYGFRIDVFALRAADYARAFRAALVSARAQLDLLPLVVREVTAIVSDADLTAEEWEGRAKLTVNLAVTRTQKTLIDVIESGSIDFIGSDGGRPTTTSSADFAKE